RRHLVAMGAVTGAALVSAAVLLAVHESQGISDRGLEIGLLVTVALAGLAGLGLIAALANSFARPLRAVVAALNGAAPGDYGASTDIGPADELRELADAVDSMRISLRSSTISRDYLDRLLASMGEALLITDADGRIERANQAARELFGMSESDLAGR